MRLGPQRDLAHAIWAVRRQVDHAQGVAEVLGHIDLRADRGQTARAVAFQPDPPPQADQKAQIVGHADGRRRCGDPGQLLEQLFRIDRAQFVRAGVAHQDRLAVGRRGYAPRIGRAAIHVVQQHRADELAASKRR